MGGMTLWVSYSNPFWRLDRYINHQGTSAQELRDRFKELRPAFDPASLPTKINLDGSPPTAITIPKGAIPAPPQATQTHFDKHWIGQPGTANGGGDYWPFIDRLDVKGLLHCALETATGIIAERMINQNKRKKHITLWICSQSHADIMKLLQAAGTFGFPKQAELFRAAVLEFDDVVQTVISTPEPVPSVVQGEALSAATAGGEVAYPIPHYRIQPVDATTGQCAAFSEDVINGMDEGQPTIPPEATCVRVQVLAPVPPLSLGDGEFSSLASCEPVAYQLSFPTERPRNYRIRTSR